MLVVFSTTIPEFLDKNILFYFTIFVVILVGVRLLCSKINSDRLYMFMSFGIVIIMFILQLLFLRKGFYIPSRTGDYEAIFTGVSELVNFGRFTDSNWYYLSYPHQLFTTVFYSIINRVFLSLGSNSIISLTATYVVNVVLIDIGIVLLFFCIKKATSSRTAFLSTLLSALNISYYGAVKYIYPHVLSVVFCCLVLFFMNRINDKDSNILRFFKAAILGCSIALAKSVEGILLISLIAVVIYVLVSKYTIKQILINLSGILAGFIILSISITGLYNLLNILDKTNEKDLRFPYTHWIAMGLSDTGMFQQDDFDAMIERETKEEKLEYTYNAISKRFSSRGFCESFSFFYGKVKTVWVGNYYGLRLLNIDHRAYSIAYRSLLYLMVIVSTIVFIARRKKTDTKDLYAISYIWITGIFIFVLVWEVAPVYLFSSIPVLIYSASRIWDIDFLYFNHIHSSTES